MQGPNVKKLIAHKMSLDAVPPGGGLRSALEFLSDAKNIARSAKNATAWVNEVIGLVRNASDPNPWRNADDEAIAGEILKGIEARKKK